MAFERKTEKMNSADAYIYTADLVIVAAVILVDTRTLACTRSCSVDRLINFPSTVSSSWKSTSREIGRARILRVGTEKEAVPGRRSCLGESLLGLESRWKIATKQRREETAQARRVQILREGDEVSGVAWASRGSRLSGGIIGEAKLREEEAKEELHFGAHGALGLGTFSEDEAEEYVDIEDSEEEGGSIEGEVIDVQRAQQARDGYTWANAQLSAK
ncbi:hypothetical protein C8J57DRAFT_1219243 [Mycena rebaudengoi]|nr:hypothetical protein C8J57DRAFT_1219243 [Mycena rebaudengoi]